MLKTTRGILICSCVLAAACTSAVSAKRKGRGQTQPQGPNVRALRMAIEDLTKTFGAKYPKGPEYLRRLEALEKSGSGSDVAQKLVALRQEALLANPLLDFNKLLLVKRRGHLGLPQNWQGNCALPRNKYDNEIAVLSPIRPDGKLTRLYKPEGSRFVGDVDLHFDGKKMLFSSTGPKNRWQIYEIGVDGKDLRQVTPSPYTDVDNYDACYLPDGRIMFGSTRCFHGVPCVGGGNSVANLFLTTADGKNTRQLTFDQDHDWCPTILNNGRVMYTRWEYSDTPHYFSRILFHMNPDGTQQMELYGSNSYWPNSIFYARAVPNHPSKVIAIISGHHGVPRMGELILFDPAQGRQEAKGVVQRIPGYGKKVKPVIADGLVNGSWPKFLHPYPLSDKYFLVSSQRTNKASWDLYLVDVFDNMLPLRKEKGYALLEPVPLRKTTRPPIIPDKVDLARKDAVLYVADVYAGPGLRGVPRGTVKKMRLYEVHYAYYRMGGHINIGIDGPWDVHRIVGTVPVQTDGSAMFRVPANTPLAVQPLDAEGKALQLMRSWLVAMPGEILSCVGCHENQNDSVPNRRTIASGRPADEITPWYGPKRGFSFKREVQPVLDKFCAGCHNGTKKSKSGKAIPNLKRTNKKGHRGFTPSYLALHPYVRRPGPESDYHILAPLEYHADTSELVQMLKKGHNGVRLDAEAWDRLVTWIDLNVPDHGTWSEHRKIAGNIHARRQEMRKKYAMLTYDPESIVAGKAKTIVAVKPTATPRPTARKITVPGWPMSPEQAKQRRAAAGEKTESDLALPGGAKLGLTLVPPGEFVMGDANGWSDEKPLCRVRIAKPFWMGKTEITNAQYAAFDPRHNSEYISYYNKDQGNRGYAANGSNQPVIRVSWQRAMAFCQWLSAKTGRKCSLPTEAQWEYACRAGTNTPMSYGAVDANFGKFANFADKSVSSLTRRDSPKWIPRSDAVNDGANITTNVGRYQANAWGLQDMHGNVFEWTRTTMKPYPYDPADGRNAVTPDGRKVVRGGSFYDRPKRGRSAFRLSYPSWQGVYSVGFRVVCEVANGTIAKTAKKD